MNTKTCTKCGNDKPLNEYHERADAIDGLRNDCKTCNNARPRQSTPEKVFTSHVRTRTESDLITNHRDEFETLRTRHLAATKAEAGTLTKTLQLRARAQAVRDLIANHRDEYQALRTKNTATAKSDA